MERSRIRYKNKPLKKGTKLNYWHVYKKHPWPCAETTYETWYEVRMKKGTALPQEKGTKLSREYNQANVQTFHSSGGNRNNMVIAPLYPSHDT